MMRWVKTLVYGLAQDESVYDPLENPKLSRQELSDLFADDLAQLRRQAAAQPDRWSAPVRRMTRRSCTR